MRTIENASKQIKWWYRLYQSSRDYDLQDVYGKPSYNKERAYFNVALKLEDDENVVSYEPWKILTHNCNFFTCATVYTTTDNKRVFRVETYANTFECLV